MRLRKALWSLVSIVASTLFIAGAGSTAVQAQATSSPVAYLYVSSAPTSSTLEINAYAAYSNGSLTKVSGSPFAAKVQSMAVNGKWLFGTNGLDIYSFAIEPNGALRDGPSVNAQSFNKYPTDGGPQDLFLDHSGQSLYDGDIYIDGSNNGYQSWKIVPTTGQLDFAGLVGPYSPSLDSPLSFLGNNVYAYGSSCYHGTPDIYGYKRSSGGALTALNIRPYIPPTNIVGSGYCPYLAAADPTNHVAVSLTPFAPYYNTGPPQIGVYTANTYGTLTTTSTASNMPKTGVVRVIAMRMAPSGKLLAVAGAGGLQVLHFNGANPVTRYTGLLTTNEIDQIFWDNVNHLYAISKSAGKLYVFTVTPTYVAQAPGSPHPIYHPQDIIVLPKTSLP